MRRAVLAAAFVVAVACEVPAATPSAPPAGTAQPTSLPTTPPTPAASPAGTASPTPAPVARAGIRASRIASLPEAFRYVALDRPWAEGFRTQLWLVDLEAKRAPAIVAEWDGPASPVGEHSISLDGRTILISAKGTRARVALYLVEPLAGTTTTLFEDPAAIVIAPRLSPDGQRYAFTRMPDGGAYDDGIWSAPVRGGELRRIVDQPRTTNVPRMSLGWSGDGVWLAFTSVTERSDVLLAHREGGPQVAVGEGDRVSWRRNPPELLVAANGTPTSRLYTFDLATRTATQVATVAKRAYAVVQWHPTLDRFTYVESEGAGREASGGIWVRSADGTGASSLDLGRSVYAPQWSRDGTMLTALGGGDEAIVPIIELFTGRRIAVLCRRGGTPPADCT